MPPEERTYPYPGGGIYMKKAALWLILLFSLMFLFGFSPGEGEATPVIAETYLASELGADGSPVGRVSAYDSSAKEFLAVAEVRGVEAGTAVRFVWFFSPPGSGRVRLGERTVASPIKGSAVTFHSSLTLGRSWPEGRYAVDIYLLPAARSSVSLLFAVKKGGARAREKAPAVKKPLPDDRENREGTVSEKEAAFLENPGSFRVALELAEAYSAMDDAASLALAVSLYRGLASVSPSDSVLAGLADAYGRSCRFGPAFDTALRRAWNPMASPAGAVSQILLFSVASGDLDRGIECLRSILALREDGRENVLPALAALFLEKSSMAGDTFERREYEKAAEEVLEEIRTSFPSSLPAAAESLRLAEELERR